MMKARARGMILGMVIMMAVIGSIASYGVLQIAVNQSLHARFHGERTRARYAAEAGIVWAQQQLWNDPTYCGDPDPPPAQFDGIVVDVIVSPPCVPGSHTISAKVVY